MPSCPLQPRYKRSWPVLDPLWRRRSSLDGARAATGSSDRPATRGRGACARPWCCPRQATPRWFRCPQRAWRLPALHPAPPWGSKNRRPAKVRPCWQPGWKGAVRDGSCAEPLRRYGFVGQEQPSQRPLVAGEGDEGIAVHRGRKIEALEIPTAVPAQPEVLIEGLHTFRQDLDVEPPAQGEQATANRLAVATLIHPAHEGPVDLDLVERQVAQRAQAGVAGAEIVDGDLHAAPPQVRAEQGGPSIVGQCHALGQLDFQRMGGEAMTI